MESLFLFKNERMKNPQVDAFMDELKQWGPELLKLRSIALECQMEEGFKWKTASVL